MGSMTMRKIPFEEAARICFWKGLLPVAVVTGHGDAEGSVLRFAKEANVDGERIRLMPWADFEAEARRRGLAVFEHGGFLKLMREA